MSYFRSKLADGLTSQRLIAEMNMRSLALFTILPLLALGGIDPFTLRHGIGVLRVHEHASHDKFLISFYDTITWNRPAVHRIELDRKAKNYHERSEELLPFPVFNGEYGPILICMEVRDERFKVRLKGGQEYWVLQEDRERSYAGEQLPYQKFELVTWSEWVLGKAWINRTDLARNPIRSRPSPTAKEVSYDHPYCLSATHVRGHWLKVEPQNGEGCISDTLSSEYPKNTFFKKGWVQWRNDSTFLIRTPY